MSCSKENVAAEQDVTNPDRVTTKECLRRSTCSDDDGISGTSWSDADNGKTVKQYNSNDIIMMLIQSPKKALKKCILSYIYNV